MMHLKAYLAALPGDAERKAFAKACGTSLGHLRNVIYGIRTCSPDLAVAVERASAGKVLCNQLLPDATWRRVQDRQWPWHPKGKPLLDVAAAV